MESSIGAQEGEEPQLFAVEFVFNEQLYPEFCTANAEVTVFVIGNWNDNTPVKLEKYADKLWSLTIMLRKGSYLYNLEVNGKATLDRDSNRLENNGQRNLLVIPSSIAMLIWSSSSSSEASSSTSDLRTLNKKASSMFFIDSTSPQQVFSSRYSRRLSAAGVYLVSVFEQPDYANLTGDIVVTISKRISHAESRLPLEWIYPQADMLLPDEPQRTYKVHTKFLKVDGCDDINDRTAAELKQGHNIENPNVGDRHTFRSFVDYVQPLLAHHRGYATVSMRLLNGEDGKNRKVLVLVLTDWQNAAFIEQGLSEKWLGLRVITIRDTISYLATYNDELRLGTEAGGGCMSMGVILRDRKSEDYFMVQCAHGYQDGEDLQVFYPPVNRLERAASEVVDLIREAELAEKPNIDRISLLSGRLNSLKKAISCVDSSGHAFNDPTKFPFLSIGKVVHRDRRVDTALIKLHLSKHQFFERSFSKPPNALPPTFSSPKPTASRLQDLGSLTDTQMKSTFEAGEKSLMKIGWVTGYTEFNVTSLSVTMEKGRICHEIVSTNRSRYLDTRGKKDIAKKGDSSGPCFDAEGVVHSMISAVHDLESSGLMIVWKNIAQSIAPFGDFELAT